MFWKFFVLFFALKLIYKTLFSEIRPRNVYFRCFFCFVFYCCFCVCVCVCVCRLSPSIINLYIPISENSEPHMLFILQHEFELSTQFAKTFLLFLFHAESIKILVRPRADFPLADIQDQRYYPFNTTWTSFLEMMRKCDSSSRTLQDMNSQSCLWICSWRHFSVRRLWSLIFSLVIMFSFIKLEKNKYSSKWLPYLIFLLKKIKFETWYLVCAWIALSILFIKLGLPEGIYTRFIWLEKKIYNYIYYIFKTDQITIHYRRTRHWIGKQYIFTNLTLQYTIQ